MDPGFFVVQTGEPEAHHNRTISSRQPPRVVRGVVPVALRTLGAHQVVEPGAHLPLPLLVGVLIDQRGLLGGLPGSDHRVLVS
jgi:hypothetical protein